MKTLNLGSAAEACLSAPPPAPASARGSPGSALAPARQPKVIPPAARYLLAAGWKFTCPQLTFGFAFGNLVLSGLRENRVTKARLEFIFLPFVCLLLHSCFRVRFHSYNCQSSGHLGFFLFSFYCPFLVALLYSYSSGFLISGTV